MTLTIIVAVLCFSNSKASAQPRVFFNPQEEERPHISRIVSLVPAATEILFALGLGEKIKGVSTYCRFPEAALKIDHIGDLYRPNLEKMAAINPNLIVVHGSEYQNKFLYRKLNSQVIGYEVHRLSHILDGIKMIGDYVDKRTQAQAIVEDIQLHIEEIQTKTQGLRRPRVLLTFMRDWGRGEIGEIYIAGQHSYFNEILDIAGGENAYQNNKWITSPVISAEGVLSINPDIIIELVPPETSSKLTREQILKDWDMLPTLKAFQEKQIYLFDAEYAGIPGPRIVRVMDDIVHFIHPHVIVQRGDGPLNKVE
ncbi:MAG: ABC transporter substrate-binding protein [Candidatus Omnitrophica bacterium]|nr:ABC transporter substrate-binding protein [Candidatus Omnitrophota bacterium]